MRKEMLMLKDLGYDFDSLYVGGGTPTIMIDELCETIDLARETFSIGEVSSETNPNPRSSPTMDLASTGPTPHTAASVPRVASDDDSAANARMALKHR